MSGGAESGRAAGEESARLRQLRAQAARALLEFDVALTALTGQAQTLRHACAELAAARAREAATVPPGARQ